MSRGPLGGPRPFVRDSPLRIILEYSEAISKVDLTREMQTLAFEIEEMGTKIENIKVDDFALQNGKLVELEMLVTNTDIQVIEDIRNIASGVQGYRNMIVSTIEFQNIERLFR